MQSCAGEKSTARPADFLDIADILVDVGVHGHRNLGMPGNALQGFYVYAPCGLQLGQESVTKHMQGYAFGKIDFLADALPCVSEERSLNASSPSTTYWAKSSLTGM